ncbi:GLE1-like protein-domain-containing protein [Myxozyma melibiosi]|uniref:mRNA export factor GLE1 n=1 Tax=Myxozyma melibiosi TaxID=54550 RepID=A0ABR1FCY6_9ASCO
MVVFSFEPDENLNEPSDFRKAVPATPKNQTAPKPAFTLPELDLSHIASPNRTGLPLVRRHPNYSTQNKQARESRKLDELYTATSARSDSSLSKQLAEERLISNEFVVQQRKVNERKIKEIARLEEAFWTAQEERIWKIITDGINADRERAEVQRRKDEEERRIKEELRRKKEEEERKKKEEEERKKKEEEQKRREEEERKKIEEKEKEEKKKKEEQERRERAQKEEQDKKAAQEKKEADLRNQLMASQAEKKAQGKDAQIDLQREVANRAFGNQAKVKKSSPLAGPPDDGDDLSLDSLSTAVPDDAPLPPEPDLSAKIPAVPAGLIAKPAKKEPVHVAPQAIDEAKAEKDYYTKLIAYIKTEIVGAVAKDKPLQKRCSEIRRKVKPKLGQITNSHTQIRKIIGELKLLLEEVQEAGPDLAYRYVLNAFSKAVVDQAETETIVSPTSAFPLGTLCIYLMSQHPLLRDLLIARFVKKCPYVIGYTCPINTEEGRIRMGYKRVDDKWEDETQYCERMGGIMMVWAAMTGMGNATQSVQPYPMIHSWTFAARIMNTPVDQLTNAHYTVAAAWWDLNAQRFLAAYGMQSQKMLTLMWDKWTAAASEKRYPAAARLRLLGETWRDTGNLGIARPMEQ